MRVQHGSGAPFWGVINATNRTGCIVLVGKLRSRTPFRLILKVRVVLSVSRPYTNSFYRSLYLFARSACTSQTRLATLIDQVGVARLPGWQLEEREPDTCS